MNRTNAIIITIVIVLIAITLPILLAIELSRSQGLEAATNRALAYARDALRRSDTTTDQINSGILRLVAAQAADPCSAAHVGLMQDIDVSSTYIQAIGYDKDDQLICSSLARDNAGLPLGPFDMVTSNGVAVRYGVEFPFAPGVSFLVIERSNYAAIVHKDLPIDVTLYESNVSLALFLTDNRHLLTSRGFIKPDWIDALGNQSQTSFVESGYVVAVIRSDKYLTAALAAVPTSYVDEQTRTTALALVPVGAVSGILITLGVIYVARLQLALPAVLKSGLRQDEFYLAYQPIVDLKTGEWVGAEALIRWRRGNGEMIRPDLFIPVAEESGLITLITGRVIDIVTRDAPELFLRRPNFHIALNLSSADLRAQATVERLSRLARETQAGRENFIVEATERGFINSETARGVIRNLRQNGFRVAIDDFGTGYSSLSYLESFELDYLKIDKSFVDTMATEAATSRVALHIIEMAKSLELELVAEGVETQAQAEFLKERGVQFAQGWLFAKPMPFAELMAHLAEPVEQPSAEASLPPEA